MSERRVAVIGGGIAGLVAAYRLKGRGRVHLFERSPRLGGHVQAVTMTLPNGRPMAVETGFLAFHRSHYPELAALLDAFGIETAPSGVGLGIWDEATGWVFDNHQWFDMFGDRLPAEGRRHFADLIKRMFRHADRPDAGFIPNVRLDAFLAERGYDESIARHVLWPSISALWGFQPHEIMAMSAVTVADSLNRFFITHHEEPFSRLAPSTDPWLATLTGSLDATVETGTPVWGLRIDGDGVVVRTAGGEARFDAAIVATHADQALRLLDAPTDAQRRVLGAFPYNRTTSVVHTDTSMLPADRAQWRDYNYRARTGPDGVRALTTWHMNALQGFESDPPVLVTVGPRGWDKGVVAEERVIARIDYAHPASPPEAVAARTELAAIAHEGPVYFCGSYFGSTGSNECAVASATRAAEALLARRSEEQE
ncbi:MAG: FAD-dependent oxidoreductase [Candidatus Sericytochromatia bacterium]